MQITIVEALGRIKAAAMRIEKMHEAVLHYLVQDGAVDPIKDPGGSKEFVKRQLQSISDLENNIVKYRVAINKSNLETSLTLNGRSMSVTAWLAWKREVARLTVARQRQLRAALQAAKRNNEHEEFQAARATSSAGAPQSAPRLTIIHIDEARFTEEETEVSAILAELDTQLSLLNARVTVDVEVG